MKAFVDILIKARPSELNGYYLIYMHTQYEEHFSISVLSLTVHHKASRFDNTEYENIKAKTMEKTHTWEQHSAWFCNVLGSKSSESMLNSKI